MEAGRTLLSSPPSFPARTDLRNCLSSSVLMLHEQAVPAVTCNPTTSVARQFPTSVLLQEPRDEYKPLLNVFKEGGTSQETLERKQMEIGTSFHKGMNSDELDQFLREFERQFSYLPGFWNSEPPLQTQEDRSSYVALEFQSTNADKLTDVEPANVIKLAKKALSASKEAALIAKRSMDLDILSSGMESISTSSYALDEEKIVRSTRRLERQSKTRGVPKTKDTFSKRYNSKKVDARRKISEGYDPNDPLRLFLWGPETRQLLTIKEESKLIAQVQDLMNLERVKSGLQSQSGREPTLLEWAQAVGLSCPVLQSQIHSGNSSREKLIYANLRMVVHIAKQYQGRGLSLQDLLQEGSMGLMKSVEKFKPQIGCRFPSYAYWWIRQSVRKAIFKHSRTIRLPENFYTLLGKIREAKRSYIQEGNYRPTKEELAGRTGITVHKLESLLFNARTPLSIQQPVWADQPTTLQEITADTEIESPDLSVSKQMMRKHVRGLLNTLNARERLIMRLRFGIEDGKQKSLSEIGNMFGLSKERVRQLESRALYRLRQSLGSHGLEAYADLLV